MGCGQSTGAPASGPCRDTVAKAARYRALPAVVARSHRTHARKNAETMPTTNTPPKTAYIVVSTSTSRTKPSRIRRASQLGAINDALRDAGFFNADDDVTTNLADGLIEGLWPLEVLWLGGRKFAILCLVGRRTFESDLFERIRNYCAKDNETVYVQTAGQETLYGTLATCPIPDVEFAARNGEAHPNRLNHTNRCRMASAIIEAALAGGVEQYQFEAFTNQYRSGRKFLASKHDYEAWRDAVQEWKTRFAELPPAPLAAASFPPLPPPLPSPSVESTRSLMCSASSASSTSSTSSPFSSSCPSPLPCTATFPAPPPPPLPSQVMPAPSYPTTKFPVYGIPAYPLMDLNMLTAHMLRMYMPPAMDIRSMAKVMDDINLTDVQKLRSVNLPSMWSDNPTSPLAKSVGPLWFIPNDRKPRAAACGS